VIPWASHGQLKCDTKSELLTPPPLSLQETNLCSRISQCCIQSPLAHSSRPRRSRPSVFWPMRPGEPSEPGGLLGTGSLSFCPVPSGLIIWPTSSNVSPAEGDAGFQGGHTCLAAETSVGLLLGVLTALLMYSVADFKKIRGLLLSAASNSWDSPDESFGSSQGFMD